METVSNTDLSRLVADACPWLGGSNVGWRNDGRPVAWRRADRQVLVEIGSGFGGRRNIQWVWGTAGMGKTATIRLLAASLLKKGSVPHQAVWLVDVLSLPWMGLSLVDLVDRSLSWTDLRPVVLLIDDAHMLDLWWGPTPEPVANGDVIMVGTTGLRLPSGEPPGHHLTLWHPPPAAFTAPDVWSLRDLLMKQVKPDPDWWNWYRQWGGHPEGVRWSWSTAADSVLRGAPASVLLTDCWPDNQIDNSSNGVPDEGYRVGALRVLRRPDASKSLLKEQYLRFLSNSERGVTATLANQRCGRYASRSLVASGVMRLTAGYRNTASRLWFSSPLAHRAVPGDVQNTDASVAVTALYLLAESRNGSVSYTPADSNTGTLLYHTPSEMLMVAFPDTPSGFINQCEMYWGMECFVREPDELAFTAASLLTEDRRKSV